MQLTKSADFAIRVLIYLGQNDGIVKTTDLSKSINVAYHNLTKIIQKLAKSQLIKTHKSKNGGIELLKPVDKISLRDIINLIDGPILFSDCQKENNICNFIQSCKLKTIFNGLESNINDLLENIKIKDMI